MTGSNVLIELVIVLGVAALVTVVFQALRLPVVLGYVLAGLLIGPNVPLPLVANAHLVHTLSELGVILLLFTVGLELRLSAIARVGLPAAMTALFEVGLVIALGTLAARLLGFGGDAIFVGACMGISSTMLVAKAFEDLGWKGGFTEIVFGILVFEDLIAIILLVILGGIASGAGLDAWGVVTTIAKLAGFLALLLAGGLLVVPRVVRYIHAKVHKETLVITALALCFGSAAGAHAAGYSVALGAFVAGVLIAESGHGHEVYALVQPIRDVFAMVFFVSIGMIIQPGALASEWLAILVMTMVVLGGKVVGVTMGVFLSGHGVTPAMRAGLSLAQVGELSFVIAALVPNSTRVLAIAVGVACITTMTSPIFVRRSEAFAGWVAARLPERIGTFLSFYDSWFARLRARTGNKTWIRVRRSVMVLVLDVGVLVAIVIAASTVGTQLLARVGLEGTVARIILVVLAGGLAAPFAISSVRRVGLIARRLAAEVIPIGEPVDLGRAPRRVLIVTFEVGIAMAVALPLVALVQPFLPASPLLIVIVGFVLIVLMRRSIADFDGHVRAGSELVLELLAHPELPGAVPIAQVESILPGFGGMSSVTVTADSHAVGRSLAELNLRAKTGATVLAINRGDGGMAHPSPTEPLQAGDVLALAGAEDSIAAVRDLLAGIHRPATDTALSLSD